MSTLKTASLQHPDASANAVNIDTSGNVGIGETTPDNTLHVNSGTTNIAAKFESTDATAGILLLDNTGNVELTTTGGNFEVRPAGGSPVVTVNSSGNVGIGTTSPSAIFNVSGPSASPVVAEFETSNSNADITLLSASSGSVTRIRQGTNDFQVHTNGTERMRIDSAGRVTMPYQPSFKAYTNGGQINSNDTLLVFNNTSYAGGHNVGGHYNTSNGRFTAPIAGYYLFTTAMLTNPTFTSGNTLVIIFWRINGSNVHYMAHNHNSNWVMESGSFVVYLSANDYVDLYQVRGSGHYGTYSYFSGRLLG